jgi:gluconate 2-dehydrogenase
MAAAHARFDVTARAETLPLTPDELRASLRDYDIVLPTLRDLYSAQVFADVPKPRAKLLANFGVGFNHIDVAAARAAGVQVTNTPGAVTDATADIALMLILMTARRAAEGERLVRAGLWEGWHPTQMLGTHVSGKTLGIIGMGRIGKAIARRAHHGFGMEILYHNRSATDPGLPARAAPLEQVMAADFVVVAVPGGPATRHLINAEALACMKPHGLFINIARGDVVDEAALVDALQQGRIAGAGLDVYEREPQVTAALLSMENVVLLPHLGSATTATRVAMGMRVLRNLDAFFAGEQMPDRVV